MTLEQRLAEQLFEHHPADAAAVVETLPADAVAELMGTASPAAAASVLGAMTAERAASVLGSLGRDAMRAIVAEQPAGVAARLLRRIDRADGEAVLRQLPENRARVVRQLMKYRKGTAGALADPGAPVAFPDATVEQALGRIQEQSGPNFDHLYLESHDHRLFGVVDLRVLLLSPPDTPLSRLARELDGRIPADADRRAILAHPGWRTAHSLPVVDREGALLGVIGYAALRRIELEIRGIERQPQLSTVEVLGDLFWTGMAGLFGTVAPLPPGGQPARGRREGGR